MDNKIQFIQSKNNWWINKDLNWILDNASFVFVDKNGIRPHVVTKEKVDGMDCFQIDNHNDGITISGASEFNLEYWGDSIKKKEDTDIREFIAIFLIKWGAGEFIVLTQNPYKKFMNKWFVWYLELLMALIILYWSYKYIITLF